MQHFELQQYKCELCAANALLGESCSLSANNLWLSDGGVHAGAALILEILHHLNQLECHKSPSGIRYLGAM